MKDWMLSVIGAIVVVIVLLFALPFLNFWIAYFGGWVAKITIGGKLVSALNILFNTEYYKADMLPMMAGALGWIGTYFKTFNSYNKAKRR